MENFFRSWFQANGARFERIITITTQYGKGSGTGAEFSTGSDMGVTEVTHDEAVDVTYSNITNTQVTIQVNNLCIVDLGTVDLGTTVVIIKIITIPGGVASLANTTSFTVGININNLNI